MFCSHCGAKAEENARFCYRCGKAMPQLEQEAPKPEPTQPEAAPRQEEAPSVAIQPAMQTVAPTGQLQDEVGMLEEAHSWFSNKLSVFDSLQAACKKLLYYGKGTRSLLLVFGSICFGIGLLFVLQAFAGLAEDPAEDLLYSTILFVIPGLLMVGGGLLMKLINRKRFNAAAQEVAALSGELMAHYRSIPGVPFPPEYADPRILAAILALVHGGVCVNTAHAIRQLHISAGNGPERYRQELEKITLRCQEPPVLFYPPSVFRCF